MVISLEYLLGGGAAILAALYYLWTKKNSAEALNENIDVKNQINESDKEVSKNTGLLASEEEKRKQLEKELEEKRNENPDRSSLLDFFIRRRG